MKGSYNLTISPSAKRAALLIVPSLVLIFSLHTYLSPSNTVRSSWGLSWGHPTVPDNSDGQMTPVDVDPAVQTTSAVDDNSQQGGFSDTSLGHDIPTELLDQPEYQKTCAEYYGVNYLKITANRHAEFCKPGSKASLLCFHAQNLHAAGGFDTDPLCVVRGASFQAVANDENALSVSLPCGLRNFTEERMESEEAAERYKGIKNVDEMSTYYFGTGAGPQLRKWHIASDAESACDADNNDGKWYMLTPREHNGNLWHKLMEVWQATLSVQTLWLARDPTTGEPLMTQEQRDSMQVVFEDDREEYMDILWKTVTGNPPIRRKDLTKPLCPGRVVLPLAGSSSPFWAFIVGGGRNEPCHTRNLMDYLLPQVFQALGIEKMRPATEVHFDPVVTIIDRRSHRVFEDLNKHVALLRERNPNVTFNVVDFATIPLAEQVRLVQGSDVLVGHHGAGMTHVMFLPPTAMAVEIFPPHHFGVRGFRQVAFMRDVMHIMGHSVYKEEWDHIVHNKPFPEGYVAPHHSAHWQTEKVSYVLKDDFIGLVEAGIRSQRFKTVDMDARP